MTEDRHPTTGTGVSTGRTVKSAGSDISLDFGPLSGHFGYYMRALQKLYKTHVNNSIDGLNIQARDIGPLFAIGNNPGVTPSHLAATLLLEAAQVTTMLNAFELRGWIVRRVSSADGRSRSLYLAPEGQEMLAKLNRIVGLIDKDFLDQGLTPKEAEHLIELMAKLLAARRS